MKIRGKIEIMQICQAHLTSQQVGNAEAGSRCVPSSGAAAEDLEGQGDALLMQGPIFLSHKEEIKIFTVLCPGHLSKAISSFQEQVDMHSS